MNQVYLNNAPEFLRENLYRVGQKKMATFSRPKTVYRKCEKMMEYGVVDQAEHGNQVFTLKFRRVFEIIAHGITTGGGHKKTPFFRPGDSFGML